MSMFKNCLIGIEDVTGVPLREGDIMQYPPNATWAAGAKGVIRYRADWCHFYVEIEGKSGGHILDARNITKIGNIYE